MYRIVQEKTSEIEEHCKTRILDYVDDSGELDIWYTDWELDHSEAHHEIFNTDYYIIGTYKATQWLGDLAFDAIALITDYENDNFGEVFTDLTNPEHIVNMVAYIIGEQVLPTVIDNYLSQLEVEKDIARELRRH